MNEQALQIVDSKKKRKYFHLTEIDHKFQFINSKGNSPDEYRLVLYAS